MIKINNKALSNRNPLLDGWRGIAILAVLQAHFLPIHFLHSGRFGVDVFFVLSGLLMSHILFVKRTSLSQFYKRRISRVFPVFLIYVTVVYAHAYFVNLQEHQNYFYTLGFLRTYFPLNVDFWDLPLPINHIWSLNVEEHSYIFLSIISIIGFLKYRAHIPLFFAGFLCFVVCYFYGIYLATDNDPFGIRTEVAAGALLISAGYYLVKDKVTKYVHGWMLPVVFLLALACYITFLPWYFPQIISPLLLAFCVNHLQEVPKSIQKILSSKILLSFGLWSFSIYLWQQIPFFYGGKLGILKSGNYFFIMCLLLGSVLMGILSYYMIEKPSRNYLNKNW